MISVEEDFTNSVGKVSSLAKQTEESGFVFLAPRANLR